MTLQQLRYFIEAAGCGSMSEAAGRLFISQPSLSNAIRELESELGLTLFIRSNRGASLSPEGEEFLAYARQVSEQYALLEQRYLAGAPRKRTFSVSTQHYAFAVNAFVNLLRELAPDEYEFTLREARTHEIIEDVRGMRSEAGLLYLCDFNEKVLLRIFRESDLEFHLLFEARPHVFLSSAHPLAGMERISPAQLDPYPCLSFDQGSHNSFYYSEELLSTAFHPKRVVVTDRATLFNLLRGLDGYTISTGILSPELNGADILSIPLDSPERIRVGYITRIGHKPGGLTERYLAALRAYLRECGAL